MPIDEQVRRADGVLTRSMRTTYIIANINEWFLKSWIITRLAETRTVYMSIHIHLYILYVAK